MASQGYYNNAAPVGHVNAAPATTHHYGAGAPPKEDFVTTHADKHGAALQQKMGIKETEKTRKYRRKIIGFVKKYLMKKAMTSMH